MSVVLGDGVFHDPNLPLNVQVKDTLVMRSECEDREDLPFKYSLLPNFPVYLRDVNWVRFFSSETSDKMYQLPIKQN